MIKADLHMHTRYSDGYDSVDELISECVKEGLTHIAITDHDNLLGYEEKKEKAEKAGLKIIKSLEISARDYESGKKVHVLGYNIRDDYPIQKICDPIKKSRNDKAYKEVLALQSLGYQIDYDELYEHARGYIFKFHWYEFLFNSGQTEAFFPQVNDKYFKKDGKFVYEVEYVDVKKAVQAIREAGGYAVIAHPNQQNNIETVDRVLKYGLNGIELNHHSNSEEYKKIIREYAKKHNLFLTGGSDYHGQFDRAPVRVGSQLSDESGLVIFE